MPARHGGPGTYPGHDTAATVDASLASTTSRSQQTRRGAARIGTGRHTARQAAGLTAAATRWPGHGRGPAIPDHAP